MQIEDLINSGLGFMWFLSFMDVEPDDIHTFRG